MGVVGSRILYTGVDTETGDEPWTSDGTPAGTHRVADISPLARSRGPAIAVGPLLFFAAQTDEVGRELFAVPIAAPGDGDQDAHRHRGRRSARTPTTPTATTTAHGRRRGEHPRHEPALADTDQWPQRRRR
jgi:ELWxxDGT repeat protein